MSLNNTVEWSNSSIEWNKNGDAISKKCVVVIPVYKKELNSVEVSSLKRVVKVLGGKYNICLVCPNTLDITVYNNIGNYKFSTFRCSNAFFRSQKSYSDLCEQWQFYDAFSEYEYMLIYQLDAWIFEDKVEYFTNMGYDYIGGLHLIGYRGDTEGRNGNGGFSLRKIKPFVDVCKKTNFSKFGLLEDRVFCEKLNNDLKLAPINVCREFSFQDAPKLCFSKNGNKLPMGCHKFKFGTYWDFWKEYIKIDFTEKDKENERSLNLASLAIIFGNASVKNKRITTPILRRPVIRRMR